MLSLLRAEYKRLFKSPFFYILMIAAAVVDWVVVVEEVVGLSSANSLIKSAQPDYYIDIDYLYCSNIIILLFVGILFIPFFVGREFSDRVINNKVLSGSKRSHIFLCEFIVCFSALIMILAAADILVTVVSACITAGQPHSMFDTPKLELFVIKSGFALALASSCALNVVLCMNIRSRVYAAIVVILLFFISFSASSGIYETVLPLDTQMEIDQECFNWDDYFKTDTQDNAEPTHAQIHQESIIQYKAANARYEEAKGKSLSGVKKYIFMFLNDALPMNQYYNAIQWVWAAEASPLFPRYMLYDIIVTAVILVIGIELFKRRPLN